MNCYINITHETQKDGKVSLVVKKTEEKRHKKNRRKLQNENRENVSF